MKKVIIISAIVLVLVVTALGIALTRGGESEAAPVKTETVRRGDFVIRINASGNLESLLTVDVKSNVDGEIQTLSVKDGEYIEKDQVLLKINDEQINEEMLQAEANVAAAEAQYQQSLRSLEIREKQLDSGLQQQMDNVKQAESSLNVVRAESLRQISQAETNLLNTQEQLEQDRISLSQAKLALSQAELTLSELKGSEKASQIDLSNAEAELTRTQELYKKQYVAKKSLEDAEAAHANAESRYDTAQKRVLSQDTTIQSQKETIAARERAVQIRETTLKFERQNLEILKQTREAQEDQAETALNIAQTRLKENSESIENEKDVSRFSIKSAEASLLRNKSSLKNQMERLEWTTIVAPMSGTIINLEVEEGEIITSGRSAFSQSPPLMSIVDLSQMVVKTFINEVDMEKLKLGQKAQISVSAYPNRPFRGEVREISPSGESRDNIIYFEVMIAVLGSPKELRPGMTADVDIIVVENKGALLLPIEAVNEERGLAAQLTAPTSALASLTSGTSVEVALTPDKKFTGSVSRRLSEPMPGNVEVILTNVGRGVRPGPASVSLTVDGETFTDVPAVLSFGKQYDVMLLPKAEKGDSPKEGETPKGKRTTIEVGQQNETDMEILGGVNAGDRVLVQNAGPAGPGPRPGRR